MSVDFRIRACTWRYMLSQNDIVGKHEINGAVYKKRGFNVIGNCKHAVIENYDLVKVKAELT